MTKALIEKKQLADAIEKFGGLDRVRVERELARVKRHLQSGYRGDLTPAPARVDGVGHLSDRMYAELLCGRFLEYVGRHGFVVEKVLDALALESSAA